MGLRGAAREAFLESATPTSSGCGFWLETQRRERAGEIFDVFPYPPERRIQAPGPEEPGA